MTPQMIETLYRISLLFAPEPDTVFQQIAETVAAMYGNTMAMVNLIDGDSIRFRTVVNRHPIFTFIQSAHKSMTLCQFSIGSTQPLLIQNAMEHPDFGNHVVVMLKLRRYLGVPICRSDGSAIGTLCFMDDHTEDVLGEEDIQFLSLLAMRVSAELERERLIEARVAEQRAHAERLQITAQEKRNFVSMVIHDLRHPLTALRTGIYLLGIETDPEQCILHRQALECRVRSLSTLLDELVLYDQIEAGRPLLKIEEVDLQSLICSSVVEVVGWNGEEAVPVLCEIEPDLGTIYSDTSKLKHILLNLVANALKCTRQGRIVIRASGENSEMWRLEVEDTGIGMTTGERQRIFDEYFSGTEGGVGLGLAIAQRLWTVLQAKVTLDSAPGQGTCFRLLFPRQLTTPGKEGEIAGACDG